MQYSKEESKAIWNQNAEFWDCAMGDESNDFHREVVRPKVTELLNPDPTDYILDVPSAEEALPEQGQPREHPGQDSEHQQTVSETDSEGQGGKERGVWSKGQQHNGRRDIVH